MILEEYISVSGQEKSKTTTTAKFACGFKDDGNDNDDDPSDSDDDELDSVIAALLNQQGLFSGASDGEEAGLDNEEQADSACEGDDEEDAAASPSPVSPGRHWR